MKRQLFIAVLLLCYFAPAQAQQTQERYPTQIYLGPTNLSKMTMSQVIRLSKAGISDDLIIEELRKTNSRFQLTSNDIARLKADKVSKRVIQAMINPEAEAATANAKNSGSNAKSSIVAAKTTDVSGEPGLYVVAGQDKTKMLGQPVTFERTGSRFVNAVTLTVKAAHHNVQLPGAHAQTITSSQPVFRFIPTHDEVEDAVSSFDLLLVKLETQADCRLMEFTEGGSRHVNRGIVITQQVQAIRSEPQPDVYEIKPADPLAAGEYAVYFQRTEGLPALLYDFSVQPAQ